MDKPRVLVIDDGLTYASIIAEQMSEFVLVHPGNDSMRIEDGPGAMKFLARRRDDVDVVVLDMHFDLAPEQLFELGQGASPRRTRRFQGVAILRQIRKRFPDLPVVLLTAVEDLSLVDAADEFSSQSMTYFLGGDDLDALRIRINAAWQEVSNEVEESDVLWGSGPDMRALRRRLTVLARGRIPVILEGETGTGKSFLAERFLHANSGRSGPFVVCDLSSVPIDLIPAHLFGATRGAYTGSVSDRKGLFELAHKGTLFLDEVQNIPMDVQKQLLQVLQDRRVRPLGSAKEVQVDVKVVAASNLPLDKAVEGGTFRSDLYMRLSPATRVRLLSLRERKQDIEFLARRFVEQAVGDPDIKEFCEQIGQAVGLSGGAVVNLVIGRPKKGAKKNQHLELLLMEPVWQRLQRHQWPGNVRELQTVMHNIVTFTLVAAVDALREGVTISSPRLQIDPGLVGELLAGSLVLAGHDDNHSSVNNPDRKIDVADNEAVVKIISGTTLNAVANEVERQYFLEMFKKHGGDFKKMAEQLLGDVSKSRAVRLRFNQLGLKVREISV